MVTLEASEHLARTRLALIASIERFFGDIIYKAWPSEVCFANRLHL